MRYILIFDKFFNETILFKDICGTFATGVTIITSKEINKDYGFTANSFTSVSIDPLLSFVLFRQKSKIK